MLITVPVLTSDPFARRKLLASLTLFTGAFAKLDTRWCSILVLRVRPLSLAILSICPLSFTDAVSEPEFGKQTLVTMRFVFMAITNVLALGYFLKHIHPLVCTSGRAPPPCRFAKTPRPCRLSRAPCGPHQLSHLPGHCKQKSV